MKPRLSEALQPFWLQTELRIGVAVHLQEKTMHTIHSPVLDNKHTKLVSNVSHYSLANPPHFPSFPQAGQLWHKRISNGRCLESSCLNLSCQGFCSSQEHRSSTGQSLNESPVNSHRHDYSHCQLFRPLALLSVSRLLVAWEVLALQGPKPYSSSDAAPPSLHQTVQISPSVLVYNLKQHWNRAFLFITCVRNDLMHCETSSHGHCTFSALLSSSATSEFCFASNIVLSSFAVFEKSICWTSSLHFWLRDCFLSVQLHVTSVSGVDLAAVAYLLCKDLSSWDYELPDKTICERLHRQIHSHNPKSIPDILAPRLRVYINKPKRSDTRDPFKGIYSIVLTARERHD